MRRTLVALAATLYLLGLADYATTEIGLALGAHEANPYMVTVAGTTLGLITKTILTPALLAGMVWAGVRYAPRTCATVLVAGVGAYVWVVSTNLAVISTL